MKRLLAATLLGGLCLAVAAQADDMPGMKMSGAPAAAAIAVTDAWSRPTAGTAAPGVVYLTITDGGAADRLTGASSPVAASAGLHQTTAENGIMKMRPVDGIDVSSAAPVKLAPNGYHIMLMNLKQALKPGDQFPVTLTFAHAGAVTTTVTVRPMGGEAAPSMGGMDMGHAH